ncbi:MAG: hypothetical protein AAFN16_26095, partial [Pseudomonadota bacterium]
MQPSTLTFSSVKADFPPEKGLIESIEPAITFKFHLINTRRFRQKPMFDWAYRKRLKDDLEDWVARGWVSS